MGKKNIIDAISLEMMGIRNAKYFSDSIDIVTDDIIIDQISSIKDLEVADREGRTLLINAAYYERSKIVEYLINKNVNIDATDKHGGNALHAAALACNVKIMEMLLKNGADVNAKNNHGNNPILTMILSGIVHYDAYKLLMKYGADPSQKNNSGISAIDIAVITRKIEIYALLQR